MVVKNPFQELIAPKDEKIFIAVGTSDIATWACDGATPFVIPMQSDDDFNRNGFDFAEYQDMVVGEVRHEKDYEGVMVIRLQ